MNITKQQLEKWLDVINECCEAIEMLAEQYPVDWERKLNKYNKMIDEIYNTIKGA